MKSQILKEEDLIGKTIVRTCTHNDTLILSFEDSTFAIFETIVVDVEDAEIEFLDSDYDLSPTMANSRELLVFGFITKEEYNGIWADYNKKKKEQTEIRDRKHYESLRLKYGK